VDMEEAFRLLRNHARAHNEALHETASRIADRSLSL